ncbi:sensor histidine kinase [Prauserella flavalba]|uniref:histidine kinase n=1 Tax=Prauserella flavalba TaxID=1477506 RepID=A0A318LDU8_9PSEU|nr:sensor histidine kinase [Prauserella flavalba]PXY24009.1 histidine kinase [Prauserella flavalba]
MGRVDEGEAGAREPGWNRWRRPRPEPAIQRSDVLVTLAVLAGSCLMTVLVNSMGMLVFGAPPSLGEQLVWGAALSLPLVARRRYPSAVLIVVGTLFIAAQVRQTGDSLMASVALFLAIYSTGAWEPNRTAARWSRIGVIVAMFGWLGIGLVESIAQPDYDFSAAAGPLDPMLASVLYNIGFNLMFFLSAYFFGNLAWLSARRRDELEERAEQLRLSQQQNTRNAIVAERVRIARDLHDVVAHHVSVMGIQAGAARRVLDKDPALAREALRTVEETARTAIGELRGLLGVLRSEPENGQESAEPDAHAASPGLDQLAELVSTAESAGLQVTHGVYGEARPVPDGVALSAYRVVQEALTNVVKHASARKADVRVRYLESTLEVEVSDDGVGRAGQGAVSGGFGLLGMRERVAVHGGHLEAGRREGGGYRVRATLPTGPVQSTEDSEERSAS